MMPPRNARGAAGCDTALRSRSSHPILLSTDQTSAAGPAAADGQAAPSSPLLRRGRRPFKELDELADGVMPVERVP
jgi:hypothetical protein